MEFRNPYDIVIQAYKNLYGDIDAIISFDSDLGDADSVIFVDDDDIAKVIHINFFIPTSAAVETLGHELAHVRTKIYDNSPEPHGDAWEAVYDEIRAEYNRLITEKAMAFRKSIKIIRASEEDWYNIDEIYIVKDEKIYEGIGIQIEVTNPEISRTDYIPDGDYEYN